eukprot:12204478-Ditylum_brightwellii.AAC.1
MGISGFGRKFQDNPTPDTDVAALHYKQIISESNLPMFDTDTPYKMDNVRNVWKNPPKSVYDLTDATAATTST